MDPREAVQVAGAAPSQGAPRLREQARHVQGERDRHQNCRVFFFFLPCFASSSIESNPFRCVRPSPVYEFLWLESHSRSNHTLLVPKAFTFKDIRRFFIHDCQQTLYVEAWANAGECKKNPGFMLEECKFACKACPGMDRGKNSLYGGGGANLRGE